MTAHGTTDRDIQALVYLTRRLREETYGAGKWDEAGIVVKLAELRGQNLASVVERILCHATDTEARTPGALLRPFLPPKPSERPKGAVQPPTKREACTRCGQSQPCHCTREDRAMTDEDGPLTAGMSPEEALKTMRAAVAASKGGRA